MLGYNSAKRNNLSLKMFILLRKLGFLSSRYLDFFGVFLCFAVELIGPNLFGSRWWLVMLGVGCLSIGRVFLVLLGGLCLGRVFCCQILLGL